MKLSEQEAKLFFRRSQRRFKVSNDFIKRNMTAMLKFIQYAITPRIILKRKLIRKHNRVFLHHNYLRKLIFDSTKLKKRRNSKRLHSQWSKRLVMHLRRYSVIEFVEEETVPMRVSTGEDVSRQLKEQLQLLKSGRRTVPLLESANNLKQTENNQHFIRVPAIDITCSSDNIPEITNADEPALDENVSVPKVLEAVYITDEELKESDDKPTEKTNFLDMLISKVKHTADENSGRENFPVFETSMEPPKQLNKSTEKELTEIEERENSNSSSDFFGFEDNERVLGNFPGMLSTPIVRKRDSNSAFVSETLNAYMRDNSLDTPMTVDYPWRRTEDGQVLEKSTPPKLDMPVLPEGLQGLRTVAERRTFLQRTRNTKYCIINNIGTIFRELQKKCKGHRVYKQAIESVINSSSVPMTRQGWKAAAWLLTDVGNYYFQTITIDGENFRLYGGRGNFRNKFRMLYSSRFENLTSRCSKHCPDRITFRRLRPIRTHEKRSKLNDSSKIIQYRACPLSQKVLQHSREEESVFSSLDIVRMPQVELEVFPQLQKPLPEIAKKYLQLILPYNEISREWAEFSVSTLLDNQNMDLSTKPLKSFTFKLPYANDRNHLIIRRVYKRSEEFEGQFDNLSLSFRKDIDEKNENKDPSNHLALECANVLTDMLNSVAIACSENSFIKDDPDNIYEYTADEDVKEEKSVRKIDHNQQPGISSKKQSRLLMELKRLNATVIDAAILKSEEDRTTCHKECCKLGCVCSSLNEGPIVRQHCGKQKCVLECKCKCPSILRLETNGQKITTEDAFKLRRQATANLARVEKEFTSTIVLTGSETLLINESQYDKKRRCTKIPKRYGDFVDHDDPDLIEPKQKIEPSSVPLEPVLVNDKIYNHLKHSSVKLKKLSDVKDLAPWCMIHMLYKCFCKGQSTFGNPVVIEKQEELSESTFVEESSAVKNKSLYSFTKEEGKQNSEVSNNLGSGIYDISETSETSETVSDYSFAPEEPNKIERRGRISDNNYIDVYMSARANQCRRVVPIPKNIYKRRNKKRVAHIQLYIAENENNETRLSLNEHVLRSVYYHKDINRPTRKDLIEVKEEGKQKHEDVLPNSVQNNKSNHLDGRVNQTNSLKRNVDNKLSIPSKKRRISVTQVDKEKPFLLVNRYKEPLAHEKSHVEYSSSLQHSRKSATSSPKFIPAPVEQITIPKISQIFSLNTGLVEMETDEDQPTQVSTPNSESASAIEMPQPQSDDMALAHGVSSDAFKNVFKQVIKNMNNLVSKKMQDIDMALRRESKAIPVPNAEILCIIRWNNFLEAFLEGFVYLWEVRTTSIIFMAATIKPIMPLVVNALSVVNIQTIYRDKLPLLGRMLIDRKRSSSSEGLAVVMQGQKMYWIVKGFLGPDKTRICPKPTPESHPLLTRKINVLCRLLINNQFNEHKKRQDALQTHIASSSPQITSKLIDDKTEQYSEQLFPNQSHLNTFEPKIPIVPSFTATNQAPNENIDEHNISLKLKVLPMQRNISDQATSILEQMVSQAYGFVRTNISFRKLLSNELFEIFPPAKINSNHHWLVLDIHNDFSHIFIPELKDLLTLDRIQKVMAYALAKKRIVKMQFSQKSLFNAYVTPKSQRKIYFGPYRHSISPPKLVLLQSVDGQMMLREVYESRHNIIPKTFSTTAFWVVQKAGRIYLDVEQEDVMSIPRNDATQQTCNDRSHPEKGRSNHLKMRSTQVQGTIKFEQSNSTPKNNQFEDNHYVDRTVQKLEQEKTDNLNNTNCVDDDDEDCIIVENQPCSALVNKIIPVLSAQDDITSQAIRSPFLPSEHSESNKINYSISYAGESSSLLVIRNDSEQDPTKTPDLIGNTFTILSDPKLSAIGIPEHEITNLEKNCQQPIPINAIFNLSSENCRPLGLKVTDDNVTSSDIVLTFPTNDANSTLSTSATNFSITPTSDNSSEVKSKESSISNLKDCISQPESEKEKPEKNVNNINQNEVTMKLNRNITIKKITTDLERDTPVPLTYSRKSLPTAMTSSISKIVPAQKKKQKEKNPKPLQSSEVVGQVQTKSTPPISSQVFRQKTLSKNASLPGQRSSAEKIASTNHPNLPQRSLSGLVVRTPSTINTIIRSHQRSSFQNPGGNNVMVRPGLNAVGSGVHLRTSNQMAVRVPSNPLMTVSSSSSLPLKNISTSAASHSPIKKAPLDSLQSPRNDILKRMLNQSQPPTTLQTGPKKDLSSVKSVTPLFDLSKLPQSDPLNISERSTKSVGSLPQPKLPNGVRMVQGNMRLNTNPSPSNNGVNIGGIKRNSTGTPINRSRFRLQTIQKSPSKTVSPVVKGDSSADKQTSQVKGIPIELPRLKKFAIVSSPTQNTTVITPSSSEYICKNTSETSKIISTSTLEDSKKNLLKTQINPIIKRCSTSTNANGLTPEVSSTAFNSNTSGSLTTNAEYGYFHANLDGLPKFVVKRVGEDFLIKVPNFNGILKLTGLATVYNYLNQYTAQKCGKTNDEIANLKWTFKAQERSKPNVVNKSSSPISKPGNNNPNKQKLFTLKKNPDEQSSNQFKQQGVTQKQLEAKDSIDLSDDD